MCHLQPIEVLLWYHCWADECRKVRGSRLNHVLVQPGGALRYHAVFLLQIGCQMRESHGGILMLQKSWGSWKIPAIFIVIHYYNFFTADYLRLNSKGTVPYTFGYWAVLWCWDLRFDMMWPQALHSYPILCTTKNHDSDATMPKNCLPQCTKDYGPEYGDSRQLFSWLSMTSHFPIGWRCCLWGVGLEN